MRTAVPWPDLWRRLASQCRVLRDLIGLSQAQLAHAAGVSQGAISRLESGRFHNFPVTTVVQVFATLARITPPVDAAIPAEILAAMTLVRAILPALESPPAPPLEPAFAELVALYHAVPSTQHAVILALVRPLAHHLRECRCAP